MYPNQQPPQNNQPGGYPPQPEQPAAAPPANPNPGYGPQPQPTYAVDYLDQIAPPPPKSAFFSGSFGRILIILGTIFVFAVGIIVVIGNQKGTAPTEAMAEKLENMQLVAKDTQKDLKSGKLIATNSNYQIWLTNADRDAYDMLAKSGVKKNSISKTTITKAKSDATALTSKFTDARLNAQLDQVYASEMAYQSQTIINSLNDINKHGPVRQIRDWAKSASTNLVPIQKSFNDFQGTN
jgi:hypothetical protein